MIRNPIYGKIKNVPNHQPVYCYWKHWGFHPKNALWWVYPNFQTPLTLLKMFETSNIMVTTGNLVQQWRKSTSINVYICVVFSMSRLCAGQNHRNHIGSPLWLVLVKPIFFFHVPTPQLLPVQSSWVKTPLDKKNHPVKSALKTRNIAVNMNHWSTYSHAQPLQGLLNVPMFHITRN